MIALTQVVGRFVSELRYEDVPNAAVQMICNGFTDCVATQILGRDEQPVRAATAIAATFGDVGEARICMGQKRASAMDAALIGGTAAHALDYDDIGIGVQPAHPSAVMVPAILAEAERTGSSGRDMIAAYAAGYEVWGEIARRHAVSVHTRGFHPTGTFGTVAAAAAVARLRGLDAAAAAHAVGIAASQAAGLVGNFGTMTKPFHAGRAAQAGMASARLAEAGMTAAHDILEGTHGFLRVLSPAQDIDLQSEPIFGTEWWLERHGLGFKLYPTCYGTHRSIDGTLELLDDQPLGPDDIVSLDLVMGEAQMVNLVSHDPCNAREAAFSEEFAMAAAIVARRCSFAELTDDFVMRPDVRALMKKVRISIDEASIGRRHSSPPNDSIAIRLRDGRVLRKAFDYPRGHPTRPIDRETLWRKFEDCVSGAMESEDVHRLFSSLQSLPDLAAVQDLPAVRKSLTIEPRHLTMAG